MDGRSGNSAWGNPECWYGGNSSLPPDAIDSSSGFDPTLTDLSLFGQYPTGLFKFNPRRSTTIGRVESSVDAQPTLLAASTESATANHHRHICGNIGSYLDPTVPNDSIPAHRGGNGTKARRSRRDIVHKSKSSNQRLQCGWKDCDYNGTFRRKAELLRHIDSKHVDPRAHKCTSCGKTFNRRDNLKQHLRVHLQK
ncbi:hypothetical protein BDV59DRAFT_188977 [Aspergillus ambiguus]|uniref:C2H2-type zinc finger protein n=1 Tax=Aspergillus ambiguus TaxID=176160 RepID=UPI003CCE0D2C